MSLVAMDIWLDDGMTDRRPRRPRRATRDNDSMELSWLAVNDDKPIDDFLALINEQPLSRHRPIPQHHGSPPGEVDWHMYPEWVSVEQQLDWDNTNRPRHLFRPRRKRSSEESAPEMTLLDEITQSHSLVANQPSCPPRPRRLHLGEIIDPGMSGPELPVPILPEEAPVRRTLRRMQEGRADRITSPIFEDELIGWAAPAEARMRGLRGPAPVAIDGQFISEISVEGLFLFVEQPAPARHVAYRHQTPDSFPQSSYVTAIVVAGPFWVMAGEITCSGYCVAGEVQPS